MNEKYLAHTHLCISITKTFILEYKQKNNCYSTEKDRDDLACFVK